jgi:hypothetical protein
MSASNLRGRAPHRQLQNAYAELWLRLNQTNLEPPTEHAVLGGRKRTFPSALRYFSEHTRVKIINLKALTKADNIYLKSKKISKRHIVRTLAPTINRNYRDPWAFQQTAVRKKAIYGFCPFSGQLVAASHSLLANINTIFYRFRGEHVYYVAVAGIGWGFEKKAVYFPAYELLVTTGDPWSLEEADVVELKARMVSNFKLCYEYLSSPDRECTKAVVCLGFYHFAHHLWNELSGLHRLHERRLLCHVDKFLVMREPLGHLQAIFPEIPTGKIERIHNTDDMFKAILTNRYFAIKIGAKFIVNNLQDRLYKVAVSNCLPATRARVRAAREQHFPLLWIGIKLGSRTWIDQASGLARVISALHREFPGLGVVFDGFSWPADRSDRSGDWQEYAEIINQEHAIVNEIIDQLQHVQPAIGIYNIVGGSIFDANLWAHAIDLYVSPFGTLQHKVGWLANKPGIIHTNQWLLGTDERNYVWAAVENGKVPRFVRRSSVSDFNNTQRVEILYSSTEDRRESGAGIAAMNNKMKVGQEFDSYHVAWEPLLHDLCAVLKLKKSTVAWNALVYGWKIKLRNRLRIVTGIFDTGM